MIKGFLAKYSITAHSVAVVAALFYGAYLEVPQFHDAVLNLYAHAPTWVKTWLPITIAVIGWYRNNHAKWQPGDTDRRNNLLKGTQ